MGAGAQVCCFHVQFVPMLEGKESYTAVCWTLQHSQNRLQKAEICVIHIKHFDFIFIINPVHQRSERGELQLPYFGHKLDLY